MSLQTKSLINHFSISRFLQTIEAAKGRGLGKLVMKIYCKTYAERYDLDLVAFIRVNNTVSKNLFASLGFIEYRLCHWSKVRPDDKYIVDKA